MSQPLLERLDETAGRLRRVARWATAGWTAAAMVGVAALLVLVDWLGRFSDPGLRWVFSITLVAAVASAGWRAWWKLTPHDATRLGVAQRLQRERPDLGSRLASAVEFAASDAADPTAGSAQLRRAVVLDASSGADNLPFDAVVDRQPLARAGRWLGGAVGGAAVLALITGPALGTGLYRLAAPWAHAPWPRLVTLKVVDPPKTLARGADFEVAAVNETGELPGDVRVEYRFAAENDSPALRETAPAQLVGDQAIATRPRVQRPFAFRFVGGDDDTMDWLDVAVLDPPVAEGFAVAVTPPAYSGLVASESSGPLRVLAGSQLALAGRSDKPLASASLKLLATEPVSLQVAVDKLSFVAKGWRAELAKENAEAPTYEVRLAGESGVTGVVGPHRYEVVADSAPKVVWRSSEQEEVVTARAVVPLAGQVTDDLAVERVELQWSTAEIGAAAEGAERPEATTEVLQSWGAAPPERASLDEGDEVQIEHDWDLQPLGLKPGVDVVVWLAAHDYLPQQGRTEAPQRFVVVTDEEYRSRLAERQSRLLGQVQQALATQREAADAARNLEADAREAQAVDRDQLDRLTAIEFQQREAASAVEDPALGATAAARKLLEDLERSRLEAPELAEQLSAAANALQQTAEGPVAAARTELAAARRAGERSAAPEFRQRLAEGLASQSEATDRLEQIADLLTSWADFQRFSGEAAALEKLERSLAEEAQRQAAAAAAKLMAAPTQADRDKLLTSQAEAARRFDKLRAAMQRLLASQPEGAPSAAAESVADALAEAADAGVDGKLRDAARDLARGRLGAASQSQEAAAEGLKAMVEALRQQTTTDPAELAKRLKAEKEKLAEIQKQVEELKARPDTRQTQAAREQLAERAARLARRLSRLTASQASQSASKGSEQAGGQQQEGNQQQQGDQQEQLAQAQESFEQAQREIDQRLRELQNQSTQRLLDQLAARIGGYIERQQGLYDETVGLDAAGDNQRTETESGPLAADERELSEELTRFAEELGKRAVFELALGGAAAQTGEAAARLEEARVDTTTQRLEMAALRRLKHIEEVLKQTPPPPNDNPPGAGQGGGGEPPPPSPIDVAELKMLRLMQLEVLSETDAFEADTATARRSGEPLPPDWESTGRDLAGRQRRLAELALELAERDNDPEAENGPAEP